MNRIEGKKLLILAGAPVHCKVVEAAREMGVYTIVTDYLENSAAKKISDEAWMLNITDVDAIVERCREESVDGVIAFCIDPAQRPYQAICEKLGVPCYCTRRQIDIMTDKTAFKAFCTANGVDVIPEYSEADIEEGRAEYPVLVKPAMSRGSRGQTVCRSANEVAAALSFAKEESSNGKVIIEKYMQDKPDFALSYLVIKGKPYIMKIGDRYLGKAEDGLEKQCISTVSPSRFAAWYIEKVEPKVVKMISALGIEFGPVFLQGFVDGDTVRFYDPGLRFPGGDFDLIIKKITGFNTMKNMIAFALGAGKDYCDGNPENVYKLNNNIGVQLTLSARPGVICTYEGFDEIASLPYVVSVSKRAHLNDVIPASGDVKQRVVEVTVIAPDGEKAKETIEAVYSTLKVLDRDGNNMMTSLLASDALKTY